MFAPITKVNEGESNTPCPSTLEVTYLKPWVIWHRIHLKVSKSAGTITLCSRDKSTLHKQSAGTATLCSRDKQNAGDVTHSSWK
jgi:hypothetical protein